MRDEDNFPVVNYPILIVLVSIVVCVLLLSACATTEAVDRFKVEGTIPFDGKLVYSE